MKLYKRILSVVLSCAFMGVSAEGASCVKAADIPEESTAELYDTTESGESKAVSETTSETTTLTTKKTTTTTPSTTKKSTTTTTTTAPTTTKKPTTTTTTTSTTTTTETTTSTQTTEPPFNVFDIYNAHMGYTTTTATTVSAPEFNPELAYKQSWGIDVSQWQGNVDWYSVKNSGVEFAIIKAGHGMYASQKDPKFDYNIQQAQANGIECGAYWYSYATTVEGAIAEAEACYSVIKDYDFTYPIYFDIEDPSQTYLSAVQISAMTEAFCSTLAAKGYRVGIYSYSSFLNTYIYESVREKYDIWVAHFGVSAPSYYNPYGMWQYSSTGYVSGISGHVDLDVSYVNYPYLLEYDNALNGIISSPQDDPPADNRKKGISISEMNGDIDWNAVKDSGEVDYVMLRAGYGNLIEQKDENFDYNITSAQSLDIDCGAYWYSYAEDPEDAVEEAKVFCEVIKDYKFEYPVYFDIEDACFDDMSMEEIDAITEAFCSYMEEQGYCCGVKSYANFLKNKLGVNFLNKYAVWIAHFNVKKPSYGGYYGMWQHTNKGSVDGVDGTVDLSYAYIDYPALMIECHRNGY
ncbi:MAG: glycoside hydrolase family 25 protein [Ruminococcus sp.]|nr:glycoside hydrolase family 25 protein [Ruminococcus sp.]